jgi:hypothetical protein
MNTDLQNLIANESAPGARDLFAISINHRATLTEPYYPDDGCRGETRDIAANGRAIEFRTLEGGRDLLALCGRPGCPHQSALCERGLNECGRARVVARTLRPQVKQRGKWRDNGRDPGW